MVERKGGTQGFFANGSIDGCSLQRLQVQRAWEALVAQLFVLFSIITEESGGTYLEQEYGDDNEDVDEPNLAALLKLRRATRPA